MTAESMAEGRQTWPYTLASAGCSVGWNQLPITGVIQSVSPTQSDQKPYFCLYYATVPSYVVQKSGSWFLYCYDNPISINVLCSLWNHKKKKKNPQFASSNTDLPLLETWPF